MNVSLRIARLRHSGLVALLVLLGAVAVPAASRADSVASSCQSGSLLTLGDAVAGVPSPCVVGDGKILMQSLYFQDASKVGGSALAAYPLFDIETGLGKHLEFIVDTPSQVAYSGAGGVGLYPSTHPGAGFSYQVETTARFALAAGASADPPVSPYDPVLDQAKYSFDATSSYRAGDHWGVDASLVALKAPRGGFNHELPSGTMGVTFAPDGQTQIATSLGTRLVAQHSRFQKHADVGLTQLLSSHVALDVGLGTALNPVANTKSHYLGAGLNVIP